MIFPVFFLVFFGILGASIWAAYKNPNVGRIAAITFFVISIILLLRVIYAVFGEVGVNQMSDINYIELGIASTIILSFMLAALWISRVIKSR